MKVKVKTWHYCKGLEKVHVKPTFSTNICGLELQDRHVQL